MSWRAGEGYEVTERRGVFQGKNLLELAPEERAREGVFLAFQYPVEIPGVSNIYLLKAAVNAVRKHRGEEELDAMEFLTLVKDKMKLVEMDEAISQSRRQRGLLRRREEAQRDIADGRAGAGLGHPR